MTYRQILQEAIRKLQKAEIEEADNDAWILMSEAFNISRTDYFIRAVMNAPIMHGRNCLTA